MIVTTKFHQALLPSLFLLVACGQQQAEPPAAQLEPESSPAMVRTPSAEGARVFFITPLDGDTVSGPVLIRFGLEGMSLAPSATDSPHSGHHHVIVDHALPDLSLPVPADAQHVHFGDARSETKLELAPGEHTLQLLFADHLHIPHDPPLISEQITVTVE